MAALNYWTDSSTAESSNATTTPSTKLSRTLTPPTANRHLIVFFACEVRCNNTAGSVVVRVTVDGTTHYETIQQARELNGNGDNKGDKRSVSGHIVIDGEASPTSKDIALTFHLSGSGTTYCQNARWTILEAPSGTYVSALQTTRQTCTSSSVPTVLASVTPAAGDYVILASGVFDQTSTSNQWRPNLTDGTNKRFTTPPYLRPKATTDRHPFRISWDKTGASALDGSTTVSFDFMSNSNGVEAGGNYSRLLAIPTDGFRNVYIFADDTADSAATTTSYVDTSTSFAPTIGSAGDHLTVMQSTVESNATGTTGFINFLSSATQLGEQFWESESSTIDRCMKFFGTTDVESLTAGSRTYKFQRKTNSGTPTLQIEKASLVIFDLDDGASGSVTATASITEASDTVSSAATLALKAAATITEGSDTLASAAKLAIAGAAAITEASDTLASTAGAPVNTGSLTVTEASDTLSASGALALKAAASITEASDTVSSAAKVALKAQAALTEASDTLSSAAKVRIVGAASLTEADDSVSSTALLAIKAAAAIAEASDTLASEAVLVGPRTAQAAITEAGDVLSAIARISGWGLVAVTSETWTEATETAETWAAASPTSETWSAVVSTSETWTEATETPETWT